MNFLIQVPEDLGNEIFVTLWAYRPEGRAKDGIQGIKKLGRRFSPIPADSYSFWILDFGRVKIRIQSNLRLSAAKKEITILFN